MKHQNPTFLSRTLLFLLLVLGMAALLACNPFAGDDEEASAVNSEEVVGVNFDRSSPATPAGGQPAQSSQPDPAAAGDSANSQEASPPEPTPGPLATEDPETPAELPTGETPASSPLDPAAEEPLDLAWAFLSQCVSLSVNDLEAHQINGQWFVQSAGEDIDRYGVWKVDPATGSVEAHNIRARQWAPQINSECTQESFAQFYVPTPAPPAGDGISESGQAITSLWATLVKCYPAIQTEDLQATLNPARAEWIATGKPEVATNYGVWAVRSNGEVVPNNRQAQGIYEQLDSGIC